VEPAEVPADLDDHRVTRGERGELARGQPMLDGHWPGWQRAQQLCDDHRGWMAEVA